MKDDDTKSIEQPEEKAVIHRKNKKKSGRTCKYCGKDPSPNYFYCPACHHKVSRSGDEYEDIKIA